MRAQIKSLLLSHHSTSALVSEILMSVLIKQQQQTIYIWTDSAKNNKQFTYGQTVQKNCTGAFTVLQTVQKKQQQFTYGQYIFTDCTEDNVQNTHTQYTVYYKDTLNYHKQLIYLIILTYSVKALFWIIYCYMHLEKVLCR